MKRRGLRPSELRNLLGKERLEALREGRLNRAQTFRPSKGPGSYRRRPKHPKE